MKIKAIKKINIVFFFFIFRVILDILENQENWASQDLR